VRLILLKIEVGVVQTGYVVGPVEPGLAPLVVHESRYISEIIK